MVAGSVGQPLEKLEFRVSIRDCELDGTQFQVQVLARWAKDIPIITLKSMIIDKFTGVFRKNPVLFAMHPWQPPRCKLAGACR